jgi:hypothetical protein
LNEASDRFEEYCANFTETLMVRFDVNRAYRYASAMAITLDSFFTINHELRAKIIEKAT